MGPKWFADIDYRWATPVKNHILCFVLGEIGIAIYAFWRNPMTGLSVTGMEVVSVFGVTAIAATIFPYIKKVGHIWESSPYKTWKIFGVPAVTIGGICQPGLPGDFVLFLLDHAERRAASRERIADPVRLHLGSGHPVVFLLESPQQESLVWMSG